MQLWVRGSVGNLRTMGAATSGRTGNPATLSKTKMGAATLEKTETGAATLEKTETEGTTHKKAETEGTTHKKTETEGTTHETTETQGTTHETTETEGNLAVKTETDGITLVKTGMIEAMPGLQKSVTVMISALHRHPGSEVPIILLGRLLHTSLYRCLSYPFELPRRRPIQVTLQRIATRMACTSLG